MPASDRTGPGNEEEIEEYGTRCKRCGWAIWDSAPDDDEVCMQCWIKEQKKPCR